MLLPLRSRICKKSLCLLDRRLRLRSSIASWFISAKLFHKLTIDPPTTFLEVSDKKSGITREIAFQKTEGPRELGVVYIPGFMSNKSGIKATALHQFCQEYGFGYVRYDATGLGESQSIPLEDARLTHWIQDAEEIILRVTKGPLIVIGSSMGGWISLILAQKYPEKFSNLILIAPGINFTKRYFAKLSTILPNSIIQKLEKGETIKFAHPPYGIFPVSFALARDMEQYELDLEKGLDITCPVRIIHGLEDEDVPYEESLTLMKRINSTDVQLIYIKDGDHRLSNESNLELLFDNILKLASSK